MQSKFLFGIQYRRWSSWFFQLMGTVLVVAFAGTVEAGGEDSRFGASQFGSFESLQRTFERGVKPRQDSLRGIHIGRCYPNEGLGPVSGFAMAIYHPDELFNEMRNRLPVELDLGELLFTSGLAYDDPSRWDDLSQKPEVYEELVDQLQDHHDLALPLVELNSRIVVNDPTAGWLREIRRYQDQLIVQFSFALRPGEDPLNLVEWGYCHAGVESLELIVE